MKVTLPKSALLAAAMMLGVTSFGGVPARAAEDGVPYWVSLSKDVTNLRVGPGRDYKIAWVYVRKGFPLKVLRVMGGWRLVEEPDGTRGWVLARFLSRTHTGVIKGGVAEIKQNSDGSGKLLWRAEPGVVGRLGDCDAGWCRFDIEGRAGYIRDSAVWGAGEP